MLFFRSSVKQISRNVMILTRMSEQEENLTGASSVWKIKCPPFEWTTRRCCWLLSVRKKNSSSNQSREDQQETIFLACLSLSSNERQTEQILRHVAATAYRSMKIKWEDKYVWIATSWKKTFLWTSIFFSSLSEKWRRTSSVDYIRESIIFSRLV